MEPFCSYNLLNELVKIFLADGRIYFLICRYLSDNLFRHLYTIHFLEISNFNLILLFTKGKKKIRNVLEFVNSPGLNCDNPVTSMSVGSIRIWLI